MAKTVKEKKIGDCLKDVLQTYRSNSPVITRSKLISEGPFNEAEVLEMLKTRYVNVVTEKGRDCIITKDIEEKMAAVVKWLATCQKPGLILYGTVGTGKTTIMQALYLMLRQGMRYSLDVARVSASEIVDLYVQYRTGNCTGIGYFGRSYLDILRAKRLLIDDVGREHACRIYGEDYEPMCDLICNRYENRRITVITTNLGDEDLRQAYGLRVWDRMQESYDMIVFSGTNYRQI